MVWYIDRTKTLNKNYLDSMLEFLDVEQSKYKRNIVSSNYLQFLKKGFLINSANPAAALTHLRDFGLFNLSNELSPVAKLYLEGSFDYRTLIFELVSKRPAEKRGVTNNSPFFMITRTLLAMERVSSDFNQVYLDINEIYEFLFNNNESEIDFELLSENILANRDVDKVFTFSPNDMITISILLEMLSETELFIYTKDQGSKNVKLNKEYEIFLKRIEEIEFYSNQKILNNNMNTKVLGNFTNGIYSFIPETSEKFRKSIKQIDLFDLYYRYLFEGIDFEGSDEVFDINQDLGIYTGYQIVQLIVAKKIETISVALSEYVVSKYKEYNTSGWYHKEEHSIESEIFETAYTLSNFNDEVIYEGDPLQLVSLLNYKKNILIQGPPGVGKSFLSKRLAYLHSGKVCDSNIVYLQFHQNYGYDDFVEGIRPLNGNFEIVDGPLKKIANLASNNPDSNYYLLIDEINRANVSKVFGEALFLIEKDKRGSKITLSVSANEFFIPDNLYLICMMNTSDRSITGVDFALQRRFSTISMPTLIGSVKFDHYIENLNNSRLSKIYLLLKKINNTILQMTELDSGLIIGHSYLMFDNNTVDEDLENSVKFELIPLVERLFIDYLSHRDSFIEELNNALL